MEKQKGDKVDATERGTETDRDVAPGIPWAGGAEGGGTRECGLIWTHVAYGSALNLLRGTLRESLGLCTTIPTFLPCPTSPE